ncbi:MAG TPA: Flp pilus assembly protein CpaB [Stellaceae bacterium]|nr:Flp pilus assembly protein CpaB [Stellaceae bacterium]
MRLVSIVIVGFALLLAGAIFFIVPRHMQRGAAGPQQPVAVQVAASDVMVAARDLPAGTVLKAADVRWQRWPQDAIDPAFLVREKGADPQKDAVGRIVLRGLEAREPITPQRLLHAGEAGFLAAALAPGKRAVAIKIDATTGAAGFVLPADRVDVLLTERYAVPADAAAQREGLPQVASKDVASVVLRDIKVLAIDQVMQDIDSKPKLARTATLEVDLAQAEKLALAAGMGTLSLALRSHAAPAEDEVDHGGGVVEDFEVSPFRAALLRRVSAAPRAASVASLDGAATPRVYHGASLARGAGE